MMDEQEWTLYELMEFLVEWGARSWSSASVSKTISPNNLASMSMLDSNILEEGAPLYSGPDLDASLRHVMSGATREEWLLVTIREGLHDLKVRSAVEALLDDELRAAGDLSLIGQPLGHRPKARAIAGHRIKKNLSSLQQPRQFMPAGRKTEFAAILRGLVGGHGGSFSKTDLFFDYSTSFPLFQIILRDATQLSTIPPIDLAQQKSYQKEASPGVGSDTFSQASSIFHDRRNQKRVYDRGRESSDWTLSPTSSPTLGTQDCPQGMPKPRGPNARGYTIDDGPWLYRIGIRGHARSGPYAEIKDEKSYLKMVDHIKEQSRKDLSTEYQVLFFHSMDKAAYDQWRSVEAEDAKAENQFLGACRRGDIVNVSVNIDGDGGVIDEDDIGQPYLEWLVEDLARQKEQQDSPGSN